MSMTLKQKKEILPKIREQIEQLGKDLAVVESEISKEAINKEIEERELLIEEYQKHIDGLISARTTFYRT